MARLRRDDGTVVSAAETCRQNGWGVGTKLVGDEGYGPTVIQITAVGRESILARTISHNGEPVVEREGSWVLWCRDWQEVSYTIDAGLTTDGRLIEPGREKSEWRLK